MHSIIIFYLLLFIFIVVGIIPAGFTILFVWSFYEMQDLL
jgi:hypothetical protein